MSETPAHRTPESPDAAAEPAPPAEESAATADRVSPYDEPRRAKRDVIPWFYAIGFIILAVAIGYMWRFPPETPAPAQPPAQLQALDQQVHALETRVGSLEQRPAPTEGVDLGPLTARVAALEKRLPSDIPARLTALEQKPAGDQQLAGRVDALAGRTDAADARAQAGMTELNRRLDADEVRLAAMEKAAAGLAALTRRADALARLQAAQAALDGGQKLGDIPGAPPALARYANAAPPTEAGLRLAFPDAAKAAREASRPDTVNKPFLTRIWGQAQELVTVRQGDHVLVGNPEAGILARAQTALDAGDLAGAVAAVGSLQGTAAEAVAGWLANAKALLAARAALATMAERV